MTLKFLISKYHFSRPKHQNQLFQIVQKHKPCDLQNLSNTVNPICIHTVLDKDSTNLQENLNILNKICNKFGDLFDCIYVNPCHEILCPDNYPTCQATGLFIEPRFMCKNDADQHFLLPGNGLELENSEDNSRNAKFSVNLGSTTDLNLNLINKTLTLVTKMDNNQKRTNFLNISIDNLVLFFVICLIVLFLFGSIYFYYQSQIQINKITSLRRRNGRRSDQILEAHSPKDYEDFHKNKRLTKSFSGISSNLSASFLSKFKASGSLKNLSISTYNCATPTKGKIKLSKTFSIPNKMVENLMMIEEKEQENAMSTIRNQGNSSNKKFVDVPTVRDIQTTFLQKSNDDDNHDIFNSSTIRKPRSHTIHSSHAFDENFTSIIKNMPKMKLSKNVYMRPPLGMKGDLTTIDEDGTMTFLDEREDDFENHRGRTRSIL